MTGAVTVPTVLPSSNSSRPPSISNVVGYEISFNRYFCKARPLSPLAEIEADIRALETEIVAVLREVIA